MSDGRIDLVDLREWAELEGATAVLALVDAVEAALAVRDGFPFLNGTPGKDFGGTWIPFVEKLSRFDAGEGGA